MRLGLPRKCVLFRRAGREGLACHPKIQDAPRSLHDVPDQPPESLQRHQLLKKLFQPLLLLQPPGDVALALQSFFEDGPARYLAKFQATALEAKLLPPPVPRAT